MNKTTQNKLIENSKIPASLIRAVVRQMGGWESFTQSAPDICKNGIDGGFNGFICNSDTESFAKRNRSEIATMASEQAKDFGIGVIEMVRSFSCFRSVSEEQVALAFYAGKQDEDGENVLNALAWYAGEEVARAYCDLIEQGEPVAA